MGILGLRRAAQARLATTIGLAVLTSIGATTAQQSKRRLYDRVEAIIGDRVILQSAIQREIDAANAEKTLTDAERSRLGNEVLRELIDQELWVQYGRVLGERAPEEFAALIETEVERRIQQDIENAGSFTKWLEALEAIGDSAESAREDYRKELMGAIAYQQTHQKFRERSLVVSPKEMLRYYKEHPENFAAVIEVSVEMVSIPGLEVAKQAAEAWQRRSADGKSIAKEFGGIALRPRIVRPLDDAERAAQFILKFAEGAKAGEVSEPELRGRNYFVLKAVQRVDRPALTFEDERAQRQIRELLRRIKERDVDVRIQRQIASSIYFWERPRRTRR